MIGFWIFMMIMVLLIPLTMIGFGTMFLKNAPEKINPLFGYRTTRSMKNADTWAFAHNYIGRLWKTLGWILLPLSVLPMIFLFGADTDRVGTVGGNLVLLQLIPLILPIFPTERALKKTFDKQGNRK